MALSLGRFDLCVHVLESQWELISQGHEVLSLACFYSACLDLLLYGKGTSYTRLCFTRGIQTSDGDVVLEHRQSGACPLAWPLLLVPGSIKCRNHIVIQGAHLSDIVSSLVPHTFHTGSYVDSFTN